jgi:hypothetical protein
LRHVEPVLVEPAPGENEPEPPEPPARTRLIAGVLAFTRAACQLDGVVRVAFIGGKELTMVDEPDRIISQLSPNDALAVLKVLASEDKGLAARIVEIATAHLDEIDSGEVAFELYDELNTLRVEEVWDRAGPTRRGYVDPGEAAGQMVKETIDPYLEEIKKYQALGMNVQANRMCMGLLLGLYKFDDESTSEFMGWAPDAPGIFAEEVVEVWKAGSPSRADVKALRTFIEEALFGWGAGLV